MARRWSRRDLLRGAHALGVAGVTRLGPVALGVACADDPAGPLGPAFQHGVASGDPLPDGIILWTRITVAAPTAAGTFELASDPAFTTIVTQGSFATSAERDFTVKVDVRGLEPGRTYYYRFRHEDATSPIGRTRTAPLTAAHARFGVASCSSISQGYFHAYRALAARADLDAVFHLGDYLYEYGTGQFGNVRGCDPPHETVSLSDYRRRHAQYKRDPDLQEVHRQHPFIVVWDDHESANNAWKGGAQNHQDGEGPWAARKAAAQRAHAEWMPIREQEGGRIWRKLAWGDLADLVMLDTRLWARDLQAGGGLTGPPPVEAPGRTLLGDDQAMWLEEQLRASTARWKLVGQQVMVANLIGAPGTLVNLDQWHGYPASRRRFLEFLRAATPANVVVLTGDIHSSWANELVVDPGDPAEYDPAAGKNAVAVEFVTPGITSPGLPPVFLSAVEMARPLNPHLRWFDLFRQGYMVLDVTVERVQAAWFLYTDIKPAGSVPETFAAAWSVAHGTTRLVQDDAAAPARDAPAPAPATT